MTAKEILRVNLFPNARCVASGRQPNAMQDCEGLSWRWGDTDGFSISSANSNGAFCWFSVGGLEPGERYVFDCEVGYSSTRTARGPILEIRGDNDSGTSLASIGNTRPDSRQQTLRFTAPASGVVAVIVRGPKREDGDQHVDSIVAVYHPQLELESTFDVAVSGGGSGSSPGTPCRDRNGIRRAGDAR